MIAINAGHIFTIPSSCLPRKCCAEKQPCRKSSEARKRHQGCNTVHSHVRGRQNETPRADDRHIQSNAQEYCLYGLRSIFMCFCVVEADLEEPSQDSWRSLFPTALPKATGLKCEAEMPCGPQLIPPFPLTASRCGPRSQTLQRPWESVSFN